MDRELPPGPHHRGGLPEPAEPARPFGTAGESPIPSAALLHGRNCVAIDHEGTRYLLRATRAGKLILTK